MVAALIVAAVRYLKFGTTVVEMYLFEHEWNVNDLLFAMWKTKAF